MQASRSTHFFCRECGLPVATGCTAAPVRMRYRSLTSAVAQRAARPLICAEASAHVRMRGRRRGRGVGGVGAGAGASWLTCSALPPPAPRLRAPKGQSQLIRPNLRVGARSEVKSRQFQELGWGHPTQPRTPTRPARGDQKRARAPNLAHASPAPVHAAKRAI